MLILLLLEAGGIELNPGPDTTNSSVSILHSNIRSIRNKLDYISDTFLDFDILCFTESRLDANITTESLIMSSKYDIPYRKDRTNHGRGLLMHLSCGHAQTRIIDLETFWNESLWVEIKVNEESYQIGLFYSPRTADAVFFDALNKNIEKTLDIINNLSIQCMDPSLEMSGCIKMQIMNCLMKISPILTGHVFIRVVLMKLAHYSHIF